MTDIQVIRSASLVATACFLAGLIKIKTEFDGEYNPAFRPKTGFTLHSVKPINPDFVDITGYMDAKLATVKAYQSRSRSYIFRARNTYIQTVLDSVSYRASDLGRLIGVEYAEGFTSDKLIGLDRLDHLFVMEIIKY